MTKHIHAELMMQYAEDAMTTDKPWLLWEFMDDSGKWHDCSAHPSWSKSGTFRRKPEVIRVGDYEFPKPVANHPFNIGDNYYYVLYGDDGFTVYEKVWIDSVEDGRILATNLIHLDKDSAQQHADVLNKIHKGEIK